MKKHKKTHKTTGRHNAGHVSLIKAHGQKDPHAHSSYHAGNAAAGMPLGMNNEGPGDQDETEGLQGGNCEEC